MDIFSVFYIEYFMKHYILGKCLYFTETNGIIHTDYGVYGDVYVSWVSFNFFSKFLIFRTNPIPRFWEEFFSRVALIRDKNAFPKNSFLTGLIISNTVYFQVWFLDKMSALDFWYGGNSRNTVIVRVTVRHKLVNKC